MWSWVAFDVVGLCSVLVWTGEWGCSGFWLGIWGLGEGMITFLCIATHAGCFMSLAASCRCLYFWRLIMFFAFVFASS